MQKTSTKKGFTLIELMVSISIFSIIMVMSMGAVVSILEANRKSRSLKSSMNNLNLVIETISRNVKFGTNWICGAGTSSANCVDGTEISFDDRFTLVDTSGQPILQRVSYRLNDAQIERKIDVGIYESITSKEIEITDFKFTVDGIGPDQAQPFATVRVRGVVGGTKASKTEFDLQTAMSQRELEE